MAADRRYSVDGMVIRRAKITADGVCSVCISEKPSHGMRTCDGCRSRRRATTNKSVVKRKAKGLCAHCSDVPATGKTLCQHHLDYHKNNTRKIKKSTMDQYGGSCVCCGESELDFLTIDHIHENGAAHRREIGPTKKSGVHFYLWLKKNGYPSGYQTLCMNCNLSKHNNGVCAHKVPKKTDFVPRPRGRRDFRERAVIADCCEKTAVLNMDGGNMPDPFDPCDACGHNRRAHDSAGCGKWIDQGVLVAAQEYRTILGIEILSLFVGHICKCGGFKEKET